MDLSYDWGYGANQYNGNIAGQRWQSAGDGAERSYGYGYDNATAVTTTTYNGGFRYENNALKEFSQEEGGVRRNSSGLYVYDYFVKDHLGNTRVMLSEEENLVVFYL